MLRLAYITHPSCALHEMGLDHPESPLRLQAIDEALANKAVIRHAASAASRAQLLRCHTAAYLDALEAAAPENGYVRIEADTALNRHSLDAARHAAGAGTLAVDLIMAGEVNRAFCAIRPPGHHACRETPMGFCLFNNVMVAAHHALGSYGLERVAIVDFDVHHGNGSESIIGGDRRFLLCSSFQHPFYPHTVERISDQPPIIHLPLGNGEGGAAFRDAWMTRGLPALEAFQPQLVLFSAGFDGHRNDPLAGLVLSEEDYAWLTREVVRVAQRHAAGRIVSMLEGGYDPPTLGRCVSTHIDALLEEAA